MEKLSGGSIWQDSIATVSTSEPWLPNMSPKFRGTCMWKQASILSLFDVA